jgi:peptidoglycan/xylan/chitin deacetylase (PgdA/CDA1 family)
VAGLTIYNTASAVPPVVAGVSNPLVPLAEKGPFAPEFGTEEDLADTGLPADGPGEDYEGAENGDANTDTDNGAASDNEPEPQWEPQPWNVGRGPNWTDRVLLTYDDCIADPDRLIEVLDHATNLDIGLLIFPHGNCWQMYNRWGLDLNQIIRERGHWVGNHSNTHPDLTRLSRSQVISQITGPVESNLLRPPFGAFNAMVTEAAESVGMRIVFWTLDTNDWRGGGRSEDRVVAEVLERAEPGDNVLMHLQHAGFSVSALDRIHAGLGERGLQLCRPAPPDQRPTPVQVPDNIC